MFDKKIQSDRTSDGEFQGDGDEIQWMKNCLISASINLDLIVFAMVQKFVILQKSLKFPEKLEVCAKGLVTDSTLISKTVS